MIDWCDFLEAFPTFSAHRRMVRHAPWTTPPFGCVRCSRRLRVKSQRFERRWCFCWAFRLHHSLLGRRVALSCERVDQQGAAAKTTMGIGSDLGAARLVAEATYQWSISDTRSGGIVLLIFWTLLIERLIGPLLSTVSSIQGHRPDLLRPSKAGLRGTTIRGAYDYGVEDRGLFLVVSSVGAPVF